MNLPKQINNKKLHKNNPPKIKKETILNIMSIPGLFHINKEAFPLNFHGLVTFNATLYYKYIFWRGN